MTDEEFKTWLQSSNAVRCILIEATVRVNGEEITRYLSSTGYVTSPTSVPANQAYEACISGGVTITEKLNVDGTATMSFGDIEIENIEGTRDHWFDDVWSSRPFVMSLGDVHWPRSQFREVFVGNFGSPGIGSRTRMTINLDVRDKLQLLNTPMTEDVVGGATENKDRPSPLCFGECHNVTPILVDPINLVYRVHNGPIERIIEVRDDGNPVTYTPNLAAGTFTLNIQSVGVITCSVQGDKHNGVYHNQIAQLVERIVTGYGKAGNRFTAADLDRDNLDTFATQNQQYVGIYVEDRTNVLQVCADLVSSVGAQVMVGGEGRLGLYKISLPAPTVHGELTPINMVARTFKVSEKLAVRPSIKIGYCKNWTVQTNLLTGIPQEHKDLFGLEWLTASAYIQDIATRHKMTIEAVQEDTMLLTQPHATAEANRRLTMWSPGPRVFSFTGAPETLMLNLKRGYQRVTFPRYGLAAGKVGQLVELRKEFLAGRTDIGVLI